MTKRILAALLVLALVAGAASASTLTINNTGVLSLTASTGIVVSASTGAITITGTTNASELTAGTIPDARVAQTIARLAGSNSWTGANAFTSSAVFDANVGITGAVTIGSTLVGTGAARFASTLVVNNAVTLDTTLGVTGAVTLASTLRGMTAASIGSGSAVNTRLGEVLELNTSANYGGMSATSWSTNGAHGALIDLSHSESNTIGTNTALANGDVFGAIAFRGADGTAFVDGAMIRAVVDAVTGTNDMASRLEFMTTPDGLAGALTRVGINNVGALDFYSAGATLSSILVGGSGCKLITDTGVPAFTSSPGAAYNFGSGNSANTTAFEIMQGRADHTILVLARNDTGARTAVSFNNGAEVGTITTNGSATAYNTSSDARIKENVKDSARGIDALMKIGVKDFSFVADKKHERVQGFIAQSLQPIYPEAVHVGDPKKSLKDGGAWGVDYGRVTPLLVKAIQDLKRENDALKARVDVLSARVGAAGLK